MQKGKILHQKTPTTGEEDHTLLELLLSVSNNMDCGAGDEVQCPLLHEMHFKLDICENKSQYIHQNYWHTRHNIGQPN